MSQADQARQRKPGRAKSQTADEKKAEADRTTQPQAEGVKNFATLVAEKTESWPLSYKLSPIYITLLGLFIAVYWNNFASSPGLDTSSLPRCRATFDFGFRVNAAEWQAKKFAERSWERGICAEAMLELRDPDLSVFGSEPFPADKIPNIGWRGDMAVTSLQFIQPAIDIHDSDMLIQDDWGVSDPASLGVSAVLLGQRNGYYLSAATRQKDYLLKTAPRHKNGAISHRQSAVELWSEAVSMSPPFLAYYAVTSNDLQLMHEAFRQIELYRDVLVIKKGPKKGLWKHIVGPSDNADEGVWSTGVAWAAYGMARARATIRGWRPSNESMTAEISKLDSWISEILDGAIATDDDETGLLRNYLGDSSWYGETSGTALLTAAAYRMIMFDPEAYRPKYLAWADKKREEVSKRVDEDGIAKPAQSRRTHSSREALMEGSAEGESFLILMASAQRDCVCAGVCG